MFRNLFGFAVVLLLFTTNIASANARNVIIDSSHGHRFLSAPYELGHSLYYEICNHSKSESGFHWKAAGFGVGAPNELRPMLCAHKRVIGFDSQIQSHSSVIFQDGAKGNINNWVACESYLPQINTCGEGLLNRGARLISSLALFASAPDESNVQMETVSIQLVIPSGGTQGQILIRSSQGYEHIFIVFPTSTHAFEEIKQIFLTKSNIEIQTFRYFKNKLHFHDSILYNDIPDSSPVIDIINSDRNPINTDINVSDIAKLGKLIVSLMAKGPKIAARNDVLMPISSR